MLALDTHPHPFVLELNRVLLAELLPDMRQVLDVVCLYVPLVDDLLSPIPGEPPGTVLLENLQIFSPTHLPNVIILATAACSPNP